MPVQKKSLQLFDQKRRRRDFTSSAVKRNKKAAVIDDVHLSMSRTRNLLLYGASEITDTNDILYGKKKDDAEEIAESEQSDDKKNEQITDIMFDSEKLPAMDQNIRNMVNYMTMGGSLFTDPD